MLWKRPFECIIHSVCNNKHIITIPKLPLMIDTNKTWYTLTEDKENIYLQLNKETYEVYKTTTGGLGIKINT